MDPRNTEIDVVVVNQSPRPRLLLMGFDQHAELRESILDLAPTSRHIGELNEVRQQEWDVLVTDQEIGAVELNLFVVVVGGLNFGLYSIDRRTKWKGLVEFGVHSAANELKRVRGLPERVAELAHEQLEPVAKQRQYHKCFKSRKFPPGRSQGTIDPPVIAPFLLTGDNQVIAGKYARVHGASPEVWLIPYDVPDIPRWVQVAMAEWHAVAPSRFPGLPDWMRTPNWMTPGERAIKSELEDLRLRKEALDQQIENQRLELLTRLSHESEAVDGYERALLTAQSDDLKFAVLKALVELGFVVADSDITAAPDDHLEDLEISDPSDPGWIALGEVKGYSKGAKTEALSQFLRFHQRYQHRTGGLPAASWYIVNQFLARDPGERQPALHGKDGDVAAFGSGGGLVIDTVVLFGILMDFRAGVFDATAVRSAMRSASGRLTRTSLAAALTSMCLVPADA